MGHVRRRCGFVAHLIPIGVHRPRSRGGARHLRRSTSDPNLAGPRNDCGPRDTEWGDTRGGAGGGSGVNSTRTGRVAPGRRQRSPSSFDSPLAFGAVSEAPRHGRPSDRLRPLKGSCSDADGGSIALGAARSGRHRARECRHGGDGLATGATSAHPRRRLGAADASAHDRSPEVPRRSERDSRAVPIAADVGARGRLRSYHRGGSRSCAGPPTGSGTPSRGSTSSTSMRRCSTRPTTSARSGTPADTATKTSSCSRATWCSTATS